MRRSSSFLTTCVALVLSACSSGGPDGVAVTLQFDSSIDEATLASIKSITVSTTGDESYQNVIALDRPLNRVERFAYRPGSASRSIDIAFAALNGGVVMVATGDTGTLAVAPDTSRSADVLLRAVERADLGVDLGSDASTADLSVDAATPVDLLPPTPYHTLVANDHPLAYYRLDETTGSIAKDSSGNNLGGTYFGSVMLGVTGALGSDPDTAISENATAAGVTAASTMFNFTGMNPFSLEIWVHPTAVNSGQALWMMNNDFYEPTNGRQDYNLFMDDSRIVHFERWVNGGIFAIGTPPITLGQWTHIVAEYDGAQLALYANGKLASSNPDTHVAMPQNGTLVIGSSDSSGGGAFNGSIDEVAVYDYALSAAQVSAHYAAGVAK